MGHVRGFRIQPTNASTRIRIKILEFVPLRGTVAVISIIVHINGLHLVLRGAKLWILLLAKRRRSSQRSMAIFGRVRGYPLTHIGGSSCCFQSSVWSVVHVAMVHHLRTLLLLGLIVIDSWLVTGVGTHWFHSTILWHVSWIFSLGALVVADAIVLK